MPITHPVSLHKRKQVIQLLVTFLIVVLSPILAAGGVFIYSLFAPVEFPIGEATLRFQHSPYIEVGRIYDGIPQEQCPKEWIFFLPGDPPFASYCITWSPAGNCRYIDTSDASKGDSSMPNGKGYLDCRYCTQFREMAAETGQAFHARGLCTLWFANIPDVGSAANHTMCADFTPGAEFARDNPAWPTVEEAVSYRFSLFAPALKPGILYQYEFQAPEGLISVMPLDGEERTDVH